MASDARGDHCRRRWWQRRHRWRRRRRRHRMHRSLHWHDAWTMVAPAPCWSDVRSNFALWRWRQREFVHEGDGSGPSQFNGRSGGRRRRIEKENHRDACRASHALRNPASGPSTLPRWAFGGPPAQTVIEIGSDNIESIQTARACPNHKQREHHTCRFVRQFASTLSARRVTSRLRRAPNGARGAHGTGVGVARSRRQQNER